MTKIDIVSGFLGAGKTTLIKKLLKEALAGQKVVLIENEFGEIGVDGGFLKEAGIEIREMNSGCICCSLVGDFGTALRDVMETYHPDRILIEPSGVGKLSDVMKAVVDARLGDDVRLNSAVAVVDAAKAKMYIKNFGEFFVNQIANAGTIILSRTDKTGEEKLQKVVSLIREHNEKAAIVTTEWDKLTGEAILNTVEGSSDLKDELLKQVMEQHAGEHEHEHHHDHGEGCSCGCHEHHHHHADEVFTSWGMETPRSYTKEEVKAALSGLENEKNCGYVLRAKGMVPQKDSNEWIYFDYVPGEPELRSGTAEVTGKLCVIGSKLQEDRLQELFLVG